MWTFGGVSVSLVVPMITPIDGCPAGIGQIDVRLRSGVLIMMHCFVPELLLLLPPKRARALAIDEAFPEMMYPL